MEVRIGVIQHAKEIEVELAEDADRDALRSQIEEALADENRVLWFTDRRGREVAIPSGKVAYVEIGSPHEERRVGFGVP